MIKIKVCGITRSADAQTAVKAGADLLGFVFAPGPRQIDAEHAGKIMGALPCFNDWVGVFANESRKNVETVAHDLRLRYLQFHGDESTDECDHFTGLGFQVIKAFRVRSGGTLQEISEYRTPYVLFDTYSEDRQGGTGESFNWQILASMPDLRTKTFVSGGLTPERVRALLASFTPYAVDVSSGVEIAPGIKSGEKIRRFIDAVRECAHA